MADRPFDLPEFDDPPVVEVVLSVQFSELREYRTVHAGLLWHRKFRDAFQIFSEHPPIGAAFETFGPQSTGEDRLRITQVPGPPVPRLWFINGDRTELIQFQADRFIHNWRKVQRGTEYPRYEAIRRNFFTELAEVQSFLEEENIGQIEPNQCEITYVNHVTLPNDEDIRVQPERALRLWSGVDLDPSDQAARLPQLEDARFATRYIIQDEAGKPLGRLLVTAQPVLAENERPVIRLDLTARGAPASSNMDAVVNFFNLGRETIVRGFTAITTPEMHKIWRRTK